LAVCHLDIKWLRHHDAFVRTTLTLDEDVAKRLEQEVKRRGDSFKSVVNQALRSGLAMNGKPRRLPPFKVKPFRSGLRPGIDPDKLHQLLDELDTEEHLRKLRR
jgi:hypothetical protein